MSVTCSQHIVLVINLSLRRDILLITVEIWSAYSAIAEVLKDIRVHGAERQRCWKRQVTDMKIVLFC